MSTEINVHRDDTLFHSSSTVNDSESSLLLDHRVAADPNAALSSGPSRARGVTGPPFSTGVSYDDRPRVWWCLLVTIPVFLGYGALIKLQSHLRSHLHISTLRSPPPGKLASDSPSAYLFGFCVSCYYIGLLSFRLGHNVFLGYKFQLHPRHRVLFGFSVMALALSLIVVLFYAVLPSARVGITDTAAHVAAHHTVLAGVLVSYTLGGIAVSTFEPNVMSVITPLGKKNKSLAAVGIPFGTNSIAVVVLFLLGNLSSRSSEVEAGSYVAAAVLCILGALVFSFKIPVVHFEASRDDAALFVAHFKAYRSWISQMLVPILASVADQFCLAMAVSIGQYIYGNASLPLLAPFVPQSSGRQLWVDHNIFLIFYFFAGFIGAVLSRHFTFFWRRRSPLWFLVVVFAGIGLILSKIPLLAPLGMLLLMFGNGAVYATVIRFIDEEVDPRFNLVALSLWMCCGDIGGFCGANAVVPIHTILGTV